MTGSYLRISDIASDMNSSVGIISEAKKATQKKVCPMKCLFDPKFLNILKKKARLWKGSEWCSPRTVLPPNGVTPE